MMPVPMVKSEEMLADARCVYELSADDRPLVDEEFAVPLLGSTSSTTAGATSTSSASGIGVPAPTGIRRAGFAGEAVTAVRAAPGQANPNPYGGAQRVHTARGPGKRITTRLAPEENY